MKTLERNFSKKRLDFAPLPIEHDAVEYDEIEFNSSVEEEPPAWHEAVVEARYQDWLAGKEKSKPIEVVFQELRAELGF